ncbi:uncharacterized protein [Mytilus edulis]|uniref:uncharacterized protein n=1 Tax=Mytilus edulis TaxID=6550 RepID=UPI0039EFCC48
MNGSLFYLNLSFNKLVTIDITNRIASKQQYFCVVNYSHNSIKTVTNEQSAERFVYAITRDYFDVKCYTPKLFKDRTIIKERQYENLICNLSLADKCPPRCHCIYQPAWKYAWHNYTRDLHRDILIVNYDLLEANEIARKYLGAFLRIGHYIDFYNHRRSIENDICRSCKQL